MDLVKHLKMYMFIDKMETCKVDYGIRNGQIYGPEKVVKKRIPLDGRNFKVCKGEESGRGRVPLLQLTMPLATPPSFFSFKK